MPPSRRCRDQFYKLCTACCTVTLPCGDHHDQPRTKATPEVPPYSRVCSSALVALQSRVVFCLHQCWLRARSVFFACVGSRVDPSGDAGARDAATMTKPLSRPIRQLVRHAAKQQANQQTAPRVWLSQDADDDTEWVTAVSVLPVWAAVHHRKENWQ